ncbi:MAG: glycosyltransferase family 2 protein [Candidatus Brockarchaeota archaeon]|nr:glycosyltransferase family 2 protein [Candidatus Brockarchaeota archaeon]
MQDHSDVSIIIPTLNEEKSIALVIERVRRSLPGAEIIIVDSSDDKTAEIASSLGVIVVKQERKGYGAAIRKGLEKARGRVLAFMDGDGTYDPADLKRLVDIVRKGETDVATGLRFRSKPAGMSTARYFGNFMVNTLFSMLFLKRIMDTQTGMKVFSREAYLKMRLRENGMPFSTEVLTEACRKGLRIVEVRIGYYSRIGVSKLNPLKDGLKILLFMIRRRIGFSRD